MDKYLEMFRLTLYAIYYSLPVLMVSSALIVYGAGLFRARARLYRNGVDGDIPPEWKLGYFQGGLNAAMALASLAIVIGVMTYDQSPIREGLPPTKDTLLLNAVIFGIGLLIKWFVDRFINNLTAVQSVALNEEQTKEFLKALGIDIQKQKDKENPQK